MALVGFHPAVTAWFDGRFPEPTAPQARAWPSIQSGRHTLVAAPTGSGKTLAAFLAAIDDLVRIAERGELTDQTHVVYVSPLKALSNDIQKNLQEPLSGIGAELAIRGFPEFEIRTMVRTGDTPAREREIMARRPPHIVVTTPESLYILLTSERGRKMLRTTRTVIVDEIHAVAGTKRGTHLALSLERLAALTEAPLTRVGLSATQKPIEEVARFLVGNAHIDANGVPDCTIIDTGHTRKLDLALEMTSSPLEVVMSADVWEEIHERIADLVRQHRTTLVFVNTRRMAERVARHLTERLGDDAVTSHHGSLSREQRLTAESRLKAGQLKALVATASLELGIDIGDVDLVVQLGSMRSIATFLQRVGRSGHAVTGLPKGRIFPLSRDELVECAALLDAVRRGELDRLHIPPKPLDILAQQIVAEIAGREWNEEDLYQWARRAYPYRDLSRDEFQAIIHMLAEGFSTRRGRRSAYLHRDAVNHRLRARRGARLSSITSGGAIPDTADYQVLLEPAGTMVGTVNEDFAIESMAGDIFQLGNTSWQILRVETGIVRVQDAHGQPPTIPFWLGEAPSRTAELSHSVSRLREEIGNWLDEHGYGADHAPSENGNGNGNGNGNRAALDKTVARLTLRGLPPSAAEQIVDYMALSKAALGVLPTDKTLVLERFFDESGGMQVVLHSPFGSRVNRAWGLALRKRFCRKFNFELQAAASEDAIVLSLGPTHSFPLEDVFQYLHPNSVRQLLVQALLDAPMFAVRWRWNAGRALAVLRFMGGKKVPPQLQRMQAEDLLCLVFPDQKACAENLVGEREIPDHPLVQETIRDCLTEAMDIDTLERILQDVVSGNIGLVARDLPEPSPLAQEILNAKPYAFLDDAPLEERRTQAVMSRRWLDPETASDLGALDPAAIDRVRSEAWPEAANADELHDALMILGFVTADEGTNEGWTEFLETLIRDRRATVLQGAPMPLWVAAERLPDLLAILPEARLEPEIETPMPRSPSRDEALLEIVRGRIESLGPVTADVLGHPLGMSGSALEAPFLALESEGAVLRGRFTPGVSETEWCDRRLLARIHRYTLNRLRQEIEPVTAEEFLRYLFQWQGLAAGTRAEGPAALTRVVEQLEGFSAAAVAWEADMLPARVANYDPAWLDALCFSGRTAWARVVPPRQLTGRNPGPVRTTPIALVDRGHLGEWLSLAGTNGGSEETLSASAQTVLEYLDRRGASFFGEILEGTRLLRTQTEEALAELVAWGRVHSDGFNGVRALLVPPDRRRPLAGQSRRRRAVFGVEDAGRWTVLARTRTDAGSLEHTAWVLLRRYGVVMKRLIEREGPLPPWRDLLRYYHRLEARGEIRGGRFVAGFTGEQFALPDAVGTLREVRRKGPNGELISIGGADPVNLVGIITPGGRVPALPGNRILYRDGSPVAVRTAGETEFLSRIEADEEWKIKKALVRRQFPERLRAYLGMPG